MNEVTEAHPRSRWSMGEESGLEGSMRRPLTRGLSGGVWEGPKQQQPGEGVRPESSPTTTA